MHTGSSLLLAASQPLFTSFPYSGGSTGAGCSEEQSNQHKALDHRPRKHQISPKSSNSTEHRPRGRVPPYLQREGQRQFRLHVSTRGQYNLVRPQDALGALHRNKVHVVNPPALSLTTQPDRLSGEIRGLLPSLVSPGAALGLHGLPLPREKRGQQAAGRAGC